MTSHAAASRRTVRKRHTWDRKERQCLSHGGSGAHTAKAVSQPRRQRKHTAKAVSQARRQQKYAAKAVSYRPPEQLAHPLPLRRDAERVAGKPPAKSQFFGRQCVATGRLDVGVGLKGAQPEVIMPI